MSLMTYVNCDITPRTPVASEAVVVAANAMEEAAESQSSVFVEHGLAPDFAATLRGAASTLDQSLGRRRW